MKTRAILAIGAIAFVTCAFILALARPRPVDAVDVTRGTSESENDIAAKQRTELEIAGCRFVLQADKAEYNPGETPVLTLLATNLTERPIEAKAKLQILAMTPPSPMSRVLAMPQPVWSHDCLVDLRPGQTKQLELKTDAKLAANSQLTITMAAEDKTARLETLLVAGAEPQRPGDLSLAAALQNQVPTSKSE